MRCHPQHYVCLSEPQTSVPVLGRGGNEKMAHRTLLCRPFSLTRSASFKYNAVCFVQNWNWNICKGSFVQFLIYNLTDLLHQNKHLLNIMEMVLKSRMSAGPPLNTTAKQGSPCTRRHTDPPTKWAVSETVSQPWLYSFKHFIFFSLFLRLAFKRFLIFCASKGH